MEMLLADADGDGEAYKLRILFFKSGLDMLFEVGVGVDVLGGAVCCCKRETVGFVCDLTCGGPVC